MYTFFNKIISFFKEKLQPNCHRVMMFVATFIACSLIGFTGCNPVGVVIFGLFIGTVFEIGHCLIPQKEVKILGITFYIPDFKKFKENSEMDKMEYYNTIDEHSIWFNIMAMILYFIIRLIIYIF